ncbi:MAG: DUF4129 domain-containing protein [Actinomycetota bacterium]
MINQLLAQADEPPLTPEEDQAREWMREELTDPAYADAQPSILIRVSRWFLRWLTELLPSPGGVVSHWVWVVVVVLILIGIAFILRLRSHRLRNVKQANRAGVFGETAATAAEYRLRANQAAAEQRWSDAVRDRFRAIVRSLEERVIVDENTGRTAREAACEAGLAIPAISAPLTDAARQFDAVQYGNQPMTFDDDAQMRAVDDATQRARPTPRTPASVIESVESATAPTSRGHENSDVRNNGATDG